MPRTSPLFPFVILVSAACGDSPPPEAAETAARQQPITCVGHGPIRAMQPSGRVQDKRPRFVWENEHGPFSVHLSVYRADTWGLLVSDRVSGGSHVPGVDLPEGVSLYWSITQGPCNGDSAWFDIDIPDDNDGSHCTGSA